MISHVNAYIWAAIALCGMIIIATIGTSYLAVYFTRKAKEDLRILLTPLADLLGGTPDVENAQVKGVYEGSHVQGRMAAAAAGTVRVWQTDVIDAAGGDRWNYVWSRPRKNETVPQIEIVTDHPEVRAKLGALTPDGIAPLKPMDTDWVQLEYDPAAGHVRAARPMHGRNDIPSAEQFRSEVEFLRRIGDENRRLQESLRAGSRS